MAESPAFEFVGSELEQRSRLDRPQARGTVRLALCSRPATPLCNRLRQELARVETGECGETPDAIFERPGG